MSNGNYREVGDEYRESEARRKYRISHPLVEKERINPFDVIFAIIDEELTKNSDIKEIQVSKVDLGKRWDLSINPRNEMIASLVSDYPFITDTHKGFLIIDMNGYAKFNETHELDSTIKEKEGRYSNFEKVIEKQKELSETYDKAIAGKEKEGQDLTEQNNKKADKLKESEEHNKKLMEEVRGKDSKLKQAESKKEGLERESKKIDSKLKEVEENHQKLLSESYQKYKQLDKKQKMTSEEILNERIDKLSSENREIRAKNEEIEGRLREERHEVLKGFFLFLIIIGFAVLVEYGLWHFIENKIIFVVFSVLFLIIYYLVLSRL